MIKEMSDLAYHAFREPPWNDDPEAPRLHFGLGVDLVRRSAKAWGKLILRHTSCGHVATSRITPIYLRCCPRYPSIGMRAASSKPTSTISFSILFLFHDLFVAVAEIKQDGGGLAD